MNVDIVDKYCTDDNNPIKNLRLKERKKERNKERRKELKKEGRKERKKEGRKERKKERKEDGFFLCRAQMMYQFNGRKIMIEINLLYSFLRT